EGLRMRFPPSPTFLLNAAAMGANAVEVAYEELYLALQQGTVDGQENPLVNIYAINLAEVQDYISLSSHQLSSNLVIMGQKWDQLSPAQQAAIQKGVDEAMIREPECAAEDEESILQEWRDNGAIEIIDDVNREAFREKVEPYLRENFTDEQIEVLEAIRSAAERSDERNGARGSNPGTSLIRILNAGPAGSKGDLPRHESGRTDQRRGERGALLPQRRAPCPRRRHRHPRRATLAPPARATQEHLQGHRAGRAGARCGPPLRAPRADHRPGPAALLQDGMARNR